MSNEMLACLPELSSSFHHVLDSPWLMAIESTPMTAMYHHREPSVRIFPFLLQRQYILTSNLYSAEKGNKSPPVLRNLVMLQAHTGYICKETTKRNNPPSF
jgi:hypothetical protein